MIKRKLIPMCLLGSYCHTAKQALNLVMLETRCKASKNNATNWSGRSERNISWWCKSLLPTLTKIMGTICLPFREVRTKIYIPKITFVLKSEVSLPSPKRTGNGLKLNPEYYRLNITMYYLLLRCGPWRGRARLRGCTCSQYTTRKRKKCAAELWDMCICRSAHLVAGVFRHLAVENFDRRNHTT
jgi:hypothetical protein